MFHSDDHFSRLCSKVRRILVGSGQAAEDIAAYHAPSECYRDLNHATAYSLQAALDEAGMTADEFVQEFEARTSPKYLYFSGMDPRDILLNPLEYRVEGGIRFDSRSMLDMLADSPEADEV